MSQQAMAVDYKFIAFGFSAKEMIGGSILRLFPAGLAWEEEMILAEIRRGKQLRHYKAPRVTKSGTLINITLTVSPIYDVCGEVVGLS